MTAVSVSDARECHMAAHNFSSGKEGGIGVLPVRAQYKESKAWKQCSRVQVLSSSTAVKPPAGLTGRRDMAVKGQKTLGEPYHAQDTLRMPSYLGSLSAGTVQIGKI